MHQLARTAVTLFLVALGGPLARGQTPPADLILHGGKVVTVDKAFSIAHAVAVREGRIVAVGTDADVLTLKGDRTNVVDLGGRTLIPGLIDSHVHPGAAMTEMF